MLMPVKQVDFHVIENHQRAMDARLLNWARWVKPGRQSWISPMFAMYRSKSWQWERPEVKDPIDTLDAMALEKAVSALPQKHREAVRWAYVIKCTPAPVCRKIGANYDGLLVYLRDGRQMLINRLQAA